VKEINPDTGAAVNMILFNMISYTVQTALNGLDQYGKVSERRKKIFRPRGNIFPPSSVSVLPAELASATVLGQVDGVALNNHLADVGHVADQVDQIGLTACSK